MIDLYYWTTPNGHKITIFLEETGLPYKIFPVNIGKGEQFQKEFLAISPNNRIPAMVDHDPPGGSWSTIAGMRLFGEIARKSLANCSPFPMFTGNILYGSPVSSRKIVILWPFGVVQ